VLVELIQRDRLPQIFFAGYSMGGNLVLKMAGELGAARPHELRGILAVSPTLDLAACVQAIARRDNWLYQWHFVRHLKSRMRRKAKLFPGQYDLNGMRRVRSVREFDQAITAPHCGYRDAEDYYQRASALRCVERIAVPTLILTAKDDPVVPFASFQAPELAGNPCIQVVATERGGHCSFISRFAGAERFWAEAQVLDFCKAHARD
jgi:predicted alpha/beta-fold hydrolase